MTWDVIVVGAGHAGCEAAYAAARLGCSVLLVTLSHDTVAAMPCNPSVGGIGKGHLVRELACFGGLMPAAADRTALQFRMLNTKKGPGVQAPRCQSDKAAYAAAVRSRLESHPRIRILEDRVDDLLAEDGTVHGVRTASGQEHDARAVVVTTGTFLSGLVHVGLESRPSGRGNEPPSYELSRSLRNLGLRLGRLKTGTPARVHKDSVDWSRTVRQDGDPEVFGFDLATGLLRGPWMPCWLTHTTETTHRIVRESLDRSPLYGPHRTITGVGARYCPSLEDKVVRFPDRTQHHIFLEPEGRHADEVYVNGASNSLPVDAQERLLRSIPGLEDCRVLRWAYAIEYDFVFPDQLLPTYECRTVRNLFLAGQINGTSGYEEAAAQGLMAGINAGLRAQGRPPFVLGRERAYIGVLTDDLVTKEITEPYRIFTSRAEHRLLLRFDNADERLLPLAAELGLAPDGSLALMEEKYRRVEDLRNRLASCRIPPDLVRRWRKEGRLDSEKPLTALQALKNPAISLGDLDGLVEGLDRLDAEPLTALEIRVKYAGYIAKQEEDLRRRRSDESVPIPPDFDYDSVPHLSFEAREKLKIRRPSDLGQARRLAALRDSDLILLLAAIRDRHAVTPASSRS